MRTMIAATSSCDGMEFHGFLRVSHLLVDEKGWKNSPQTQPYQRDLDLYGIGRHVSRTIRFYQEFANF